MTTVNYLTYTDLANALNLVQNSQPFTYNQIEEAFTRLQELTPTELRSELSKTAKKLSVQQTVS